MKIVCIGRNYADHAKELGNAVPTEPVVFFKPQSAIISSRTPFYYPEFTNELHYEGELVYRICKNGRYIKPGRAHDYYDAVAVGIDFTARDIQDHLRRQGLPWEKAKAFDGSAMVGQFIPKENFDYKKPLEFSLSLNGDMVQQGFSSDMVFNINEIIAHVSNYFTLNIGDIIFTGTPAGVGECTVGDVLEGYLEGEKNFTLEIR